MRVIGTINLMLVLIFCASAALQWNDPDPVLWSLFYALAAAACLAWHFDYLPPTVAIAIALVCTLWVMALGPQLARVEQWSEVWASFSMQSQSVEAVREAGGLLLVGLWMLLLACSRLVAHGRKQLP